MLPPLLLLCALRARTGRHSANFKHANKRKPNAEWNFILPESRSANPASAGGSHHEMTSSSRTDEETSISMSGPLTCSDERIRDGGPLFPSQPANHGDDESRRKQVPKRLKKASDGPKASIAAQDVLEFFGWNATIAHQSARCSASQLFFYPHELQAEVCPANSVFGRTLPPSSLLCHKGRPLSRK